MPGNASDFMCMVLSGGCPLFPTANSACEEGVVRRSAAGTVCDDLFWEIRGCWSVLG